jgi:hypothetical protein
MLGLLQQSITTCKKRHDWLDSFFCRYHEDQTPADCTETVERPLTGHSAVLSVAMAKVEQSKHESNDLSPEEVEATNAAGTSDV